MKIVKLFAMTIALSVSFSFAAEPANVSVLLQEGLRLYSESQYVRALDLFKQVQEADPSNATASDYIRTTKQKILEWERSGKGDNEPKGATTWDSLLNSKSNAGETSTNSKDIIAARRSLVEKMRNRSSNTDNIVQISNTPKGIDVKLFHDQLFLPGLQTMRDESLPILENVAQLIRTGGDRDVTVRSVSHSESEDPYLLYPELPVPSADPSLPQIKKTDAAAIFQDIESTRALILFTYLAQRSLGHPATSANQ